MAQVLSFADHVRRERRQPGGQFNPSKVAQRFQPDQYLVYAAEPGHNHQVMPAFQLQPKVSDELVKTMSAMPAGFPSVFQGDGPMVMDIVASARRVAQGTSDLVSGLAAYFEVHRFESPFSVGSPQEMVNWRIQNGLNPSQIQIFERSSNGFEDLQTAERILSRRAPGPVIPVTPLDLSLVACAVARRLNKDAFLAQLDILIPIPETDGSVKSDIIDMQGVIGVCVVEANGELRTLIPAMESTRITLIPAADLLGNVRTHPITGLPVYLPDIQPSGEYVSPNPHPPLSAVTVLSDGVALTIAYMSQSDISFAKLMREVQQREGVLQPRTWIKKNRMPFEEYKQKMAEVLKPLDDAMYLSPEIGALHGALVSTFEFYMGCYQQGSLHVEQVSELLGQLFGVFKTGFEVISQYGGNDKIIRETVIAMHKTLLIAVMHDKLQQKHFDIFDAAIRKSLGDSFPNYDMEHVNDPHVEERKPKLVLVKK